MAVALLVVLGVLAGNGAGAQTTTTSSTTTSSSTTSSPLVTTTTSTSTTSTTVVNPCTGQPCTVQPPQATLSGSGGEAALLLSRSCWRSPTPTAQGLVTACLLATLAPDIPVGLVVRRGETLTLQFVIGMAPTEVRLLRFPDGEPTTLTPANPTVFVNDLPVGVYLISFATKWNQGDASYVLKVDVRGPAPVSDPRPLALTG